MSPGSGQCLCGAVRFEAEAVEPRVSACHCIMCQRWAGGPFITASADKVTFQGEEHLTRYRSSDWAERGFCNVCGSNLFYHLLKLDSHELCLGSLDDKQGLSMTSEIFVDSKPEAYVFAGDHERLTEAETLARFKEFT